MKFSIIIPVYNVERWLAVCLDSVLAQTYPGWECVCVDDGSTDNSGRLLDEYAAKDKRIKVIHQVNGGLCRARNRALDEVSGEWVIFCDSDDYLPRDVLAAFLEKIRVNPRLDCVIFRPEQVDEEGVAIDRQCNNVFHATFVRDFVRAAIHAPDMWCVIGGPWGRAYRRSLIEDIHLRCIEPYAMSEDGLFNAEFYSFCREIEVDHQITGTYYRIVTGGLSRRNSIDKNLSYYRILEHCLDFAKKHDKNEVLYFAARKGLLMFRWIFLKNMGVDNVSYAQKLIDDSRFKPVLLWALSGHGPYWARCVALLMRIIPKDVLKWVVHFCQRIRGVK